MNDLVMYFEKEKFLRQMLEGIFKLKGVKIHTEESIADKFFLIEDLMPKIVIVDLNTVSENELEKFFQFNISKIIATTDENSLLLKKYQNKFHSVIFKPLKASDIFNQIFQD